MQFLIQNGFKKWIRVGVPSRQGIQNKVPLIHPTFFRFRVANDWNQERPKAFLRVTHPPRTSNEAERFIRIQGWVNPFKKYRYQIFF